MTTLDDGPGVLSETLQRIDRLLAEPQTAMLVAIAVGAIGMLVLFGLVRLVARSRQATTAEPTVDPADAMIAQQIAGLAEGQHRLAGALSQGLAQMGEVGAKAQIETAERAAQSFGAIAERLEAIDRAQDKLERISGDVLGLQDILANKQSRGRFGEIQLNELIADALPPSAFTLQATLSNGRRADALIHLPNPPGPIAVDAKFPLEPFEALRQAQRASDHDAQNAAARAIRQAIKAHVDAIAERYVLPGETADGAIMFLPSEAVFAELHASFADVVRRSFAKRVWIVSPTTLMATLMSMRAALQHMRLQDGAADLRREVGLLARDVERLAERSEKLRSAFAQAQRSLDDIGISAQKALKRADRLTGGEDADGSVETDEASTPEATEIDAAAPWPRQRTA